MSMAAPLNFSVWLNVASFLFLIGVERLNGLIREVVHLRRFSPFMVGNENPVGVSLFQFIDDTLFIGEESLQNVVLLKCVLRCFELVLGLKVNFHKSRLVGNSMKDNVI